MTAHLVCCECGAPVTSTYARYQLEQFEYISQAEGHGRIVTVDAAVACSTRCLRTYLESIEREAST